MRFFSEEDNKNNWYYFLSLVINLMLIWWQKPEIGLLFTILATIHYVTVAFYGISGLYEEFDDGCTTKSAYVYLGIHLLLFVIAVVFLALASLLVLNLFEVAAHCNIVAGWHL